MSEYIYTVEKDCPICGEKTHVTKLKTRLITLETDEDFCVHYKGVNPYRYRIWMCEHCGFAADEKQFTEEPISVRDKAKIKELLEGHKINLPYTEERTVEEAIRAYKLDLSPASQSVVASVSTFASHSAFCAHHAGSSPSTQVTTKSMGAFVSIFIT